MKQNQGCRGLSLLEVLLVVAVMSVLLLAVMRWWQQAQQQQALSQGATQIQQLLQTALDYQARYGQWPYQASQLVENKPGGLLDQVGIERWLGQAHDLSLCTPLPGDGHLFWMAQNSTGRVRYFKSRYGPCRHHALINVVLPKYGEHTSSPVFALQVTLPNEKLAQRLATRLPMAHDNGKRVTAYAYGLSYSSPKIQPKSFLVNAGIIAGCEGEGCHHQTLPLPSEKECPPGEYASHVILGPQWFSSDRGVEYINESPDVRAARVKKICEEKPDYLDADFIEKLCEASGEALDKLIETTLGPEGVDKRLSFRVGVGEIASSANGFNLILKNQFYLCPVKTKNERVVDPHMAYYLTLCLPQQRWEAPELNEKISTHSEQQCGRYWLGALLSHELACGEHLINQTGVA